MPHSPLPSSTTALTPSTTSKNISIAPASRSGRRSDHPLHRSDGRQGSPASSGPREGARRPIARRKCCAASPPSRRFRSSISTPPSAEAPTTTLVEMLALESRHPGRRRRPNRRTGQRPYRPGSVPRHRRHGCLRRRRAPTTSSCQALVESHRPRPHRSRARFEKRPHRRKRLAGSHRLHRRRSHPPAGALLLRLPLHLRG